MGDGADEEDARSGNNPKPTRLTTSLGWWWWLGGESVMDVRTWMLSSSCCCGSDGCISSAIAVTTTIKVGSQSASTRKCRNSLVSSPTAARYLCVICRLGLVNETVSSYHHECTLGLSIKTDAVNPSRRKSCRHVEQELTQIPHINQGTNKFQIQKF